MKKPTQYQKRIIKYLEEGNTLRSYIPGIYYKNKKLKVETVDAILNNCPLCEIGIQMKVMKSFMTIWVICHQNNVQNIINSYSEKGHIVRSVKSLTPNSNYEQSKKGNRDERGQCWLKQ